MNITATLSDHDTGSGIANKSITITINGTTLTGKTNDSGISTVTYTPTNGGIYQISASFAGDTTYAPSNGTNNLTVYQVPVASFTVNTTSGSAPLTVQFYDTSANNPTSWSWTFGDNSNVYVADTYNNAIKGIFTNGTIITLATGFNLPGGVAVDSAGNVYVADTCNNAIKEILTNGTIITLGNGFSYCLGVAVDASGNVYVADSGNNLVKEILTNGTIITLASGFNNPCGIAVDSAGNVYVVDTGNNAVKKILTNGTIVTLATGFNNPWGVAVDSAGNVYVADTYNNAIKKILTNGTIITLATEFNLPCGVAVDSAGNVYVADTCNNTIKEIFTNGTIVTLATGFNNPWGVAVAVATGSIVPDPLHTFNIPGTYTIILTVSNPAGNSTKTMTITVYTPTQSGTADKQLNEQNSNPTDDGQPYIHASQVTMIISMQKTGFNPFILLLAFLMIMGGG